MVDQVAGIHKHWRDVIQTAIIFTVLTTIAVGLRLWTKSTTKSGLGADDLLIGISLLMFYGLSGVTTYTALYGRDMQSVLDLPRYIKFVYANGELYCPLILTINTSILLFYRRIFSVPEFKRLTTICMTLNIIWFIPMFIGSTLTCYPVSAMWDIFNFPAHCMNYPPFFVVMITTELALCCITLALPVVQVARLRMSRRARATVIIIFMLGGFVIITGIVRIAVSYFPGEPMIDLALDLYWNNIHIGTAIICACLPTYRPVARATASFISSKLSSLRSKDQSDGSMAYAARDKYSRFDSGHSKQGSAIDSQKVSETHLPLSPLKSEYPKQSHLNHLDLNE